MLRRKKNCSLPIKKKEKEILKSMLKIKKNWPSRSRVRRPIKINKKLVKIKNIPKIKHQIIIQLIFNSITRRTSSMIK